MRRALAHSPGQGVSNEASKHARPGLTPHTPPTNSTDGQDNYYSRPEDRVRESSRTMFEQENDRRIAELSSQVSMLKEVRLACVFGCV